MKIKNTNNSAENIQNAYITNNKTTIQCFECHKMHSFDLSKFNLTNTRHVKYKCNCGNIQKANLERRSNYRKDVNLVGQFKDGNHKGLLSIINISQTGLKFNTNDSISKPNSILSIDFYLDNKLRTQLEMDVRIVYQDGKNYGTEFIKDSQFKYNKTLGFYLMK